MTVLVTGSSRGLGKALALAFAAAGYDIILSGRDERALAITEALIRAYGRDCETIIGDIRIPAVRESMMLAAKRQGVDILVNNAGVYARGAFGDMLPGDVQDIIAVNFTVPILLTLAIYPIMAAKGHGLIVNINSIAGKVPNTAEAVYCASKRGLAGFARSFQAEAIRSGVRVMSIYLGAMDTGMTGRADRESLIQPDEAATAIVTACRDYRTMRVMELDLSRALCA